MGKKQKREIDRQYEESVQQLNRQEKAALWRLNEEYENERVKIAAARESTLWNKQDVSSRFHEGKKSLTRYQAAKEEAFQKACLAVKAEIDLLKAALYACMTGEVKIVQGLLTKSLKLRFDFFHYFPLHIAAENNQVKIITLLSRHGVDLNRKNTRSETALELAEVQGNMDAVTELQRLNRQTEALQLAVEKNDLVAFRAARARGADINVQNSRGETVLQTVLHQMLQKPEASRMINSLIIAGVDVNRLDKDKNTALHFILVNPKLWRQGTLLVETLVTAQASLTARNRAGLTVLQLAVQQQLPFPLIKLLVEQNADLTALSGKPSLAPAELALAHPEGRVRTFLLETLAMQDLRPLVEEREDPVLMGQGPQWTSDYGWAEPKYNATIKSVFAAVNGQKRLFVLGRAADGIHLYRDDFNGKAWQKPTLLSHWSNADGWDQAKYFSTIRTVVLRIQDGKEHIFWLARHSQGIQLWRHDSESDKITLCQPGLFWSDKDGWDRPEYYSTLKTAVLRQPDGSETLFLLARHSEGIALWQYDPKLDKWTHHPDGPQWSDDNGWKFQQYFATLRLLPLRQADGTEHLFLLGRGKDGILLSSYQPETRTWRVRKAGPGWSDAAGWTAHYGSMIQVQRLCLEGVEHLFLLARHDGGIALSQYNPNTDAWTPCASGPNWGHQAGWTPECHSSTVQTQVIKGYEQTDLLVLFGRTSLGLIAEVYHPVRNTWLPLPFNVRLLDTLGWTAAEHYSTIQTHIEQVNHQHLLVVLARSRAGIQGWSYRINVRQLEWEFHQRALERSVDSLLEEFLERVAAVSSDLLTAAHRGHLPETLRHAALQNLFKQEPLFKKEGMSQLKEHLRLKAQAALLADAPGYFLFDGVNLIKSKNQPKGPQYFYNYFDLGEEDKKLKKQILYYSNQHGPVLYRDKGFAYGVSLESPYASRQKMTQQYKSEILEAYYQQEALKKIRAHLILKAMGERLAGQRGEQIQPAQYFYFNGDEIVTVQHLPPSVEGNYVDFSAEIKHQLVYYKKEHRALFYQGKGFAHSVSLGTPWASRDSLIRGFPSPFVSFYETVMSGADLRAATFLMKIEQANQRLLVAAANNDLVGIEAALQQGADINATDEQGRHGLHLSLLAHTPLLLVVKKLIQSGIDIEHTCQAGKTAFSIVYDRGLMEIAVLLVDKPIVGWILTRDVFQKRFAELCQQSEKYLATGADELQKCQKLFGYYYALSKTAPHIYYAWPMMMMTKALAETVIQGAAVAPERVDLTQAKKELLLRAEAFFKKTRALQVLLMEYGLEALKAMPEFKAYESLLAPTLSLKQAAKERLKVEEVDKAWEGAYKAANILPVIGTFLSTYAKEVFTVELAEAKVKAAVSILVARPKTERQAWKKSLKIENGGVLVRDAAQHELIQLPPKISLKEGLRELGTNAEEVSSVLSEQSIFLKQERQALETWLDQKEKEYLEQLAQLEGQLQGLSAGSAVLSVEFQQAYTQIKREFAQLRQQAADESAEAKRKLHRAKTKQLVCLGVATVIAAVVTPVIAGSLAKSFGIVAQTVNGVVTKSVTHLALEAAVNGALIGGMTAGFSGDTSNILKNALVSGFLAGFRVVAVGALAPTITSEALRTTLVSGLTATIRSGIDGGNVQQAIYMSIGQNLILPGENQGFLEFVTTQALSVLVSSGVQSLVTHTDFMENVATMATATIVQVAAASVGHEIHEQLVVAMSSGSSGPGESGVLSETEASPPADGQEPTADEQRPRVVAAPHQGSHPEDYERYEGQFPGTSAPRPLDLGGGSGVRNTVDVPSSNTDLDLGQRFGRAAQAFMGSAAPGTEVSFPAHGDERHNSANPSNSALILRPSRPNHESPNQDHQRQMVPVAPKAPERRSLWERGQKLKEELEEFRRQNQINRSAGFLDMVTFGATIPLSRGIADSNSVGYRQGQVIGGVTDLVPAHRGLTFAVNEGRYVHRALTLERRGYMGHIFSTVRGQVKSGHMSDTFLNRREIAKTYLRKENFLGEDRYGNKWYAESRSDGQQSWVKFHRNGKIVSGGVNDSPHEYHELYGLCKRRK